MNSIQKELAARPKKCKAFDDVMNTVLYIGIAFVVILILRRLQ